MTGSPSPISLLRALTVFALLCGPVVANNDWGKPCDQASCEYDVPDGGDPSSGTIKIWAETTDAIADITTASDWEIVGCDKNAIAQDIRIVCKTEDSKACGRLFKAGGPDGKVVRLPEECGQNAFARIAKSYVAEDQSIPSHIAARLVRRAGVPPKVEALRIDTDFAAVDSKKFGKVNFAIQGANVPGAKGNIPIGKPVLKKHHKVNLVNTNKKIDSVISRLPLRLHYPRDGNAHLTTRDLEEIAHHPAFDLTPEQIEILYKRGWFSKAFKSIKKAVKDAAKTLAKVGKGIVKGAKNLGEEIVDVGEDIVEVVFEGVDNGLDAIGDGLKKATEFGEEVLGKLTSIEFEESVNFSPVNIDKSFNLFKAQQQCEGRTARVSIDVNAKASSLVTLGVMAAGTLIPPKFEDFAISATLSADFDSSIDFDAGLSGNFDTGKVKFFEVGIPGLSFPGILTLGPSFRVDGQATGRLDVNVDLSVGVNYKLEKAQMVIPKRKSQKGNLVIEDTPLKLSAAPSAEATGVIEAHLIPSLNIGLDAIGGIVKANAYVNLDASAGARLELSASGNVGLEVPVFPDSVKRRSLPNRLPARQEDVQAEEGQEVSEEPEGSEEQEISEVQEEGKEEEAVVASPEPSPLASSPTDVPVVSSEAPFTGWETSVTYGGCFEVYAGLAVNVGAEGSFFGFFDEKANFNLLSKTFDLFKKCFGNQKRSLGASFTPRNRRMDMSKRMARISHNVRSVSSLDIAALDKRGWLCPESNSEGLKTVVESADASP